MLGRRSAEMVVHVMPDCIGSVSMAYGDGLWPTDWALDLARLLDAVVESLGVAACRRRSTIHISSGRMTGRQAQTMPRHTSTTVHIAAWTPYPESQP